MSKVACETATAAALPDAGAGAVQSCGRGGADSVNPRADDAGAPAESFLLRVPDSVWLTHLFGAALRRDGSTKGSSNPKAAAEAAATRKGAPRAADSRRSTTTASSSKTAVVIGVLPATASKVVGRERRRAPGRVVVAARASWRRPAAGARVFASEAAAGPEPVSPKVSCFGAVLPETERSAAAAPPAGAQEEEEEGGGCWASLRAALLGHSDLSASEPASKAAAAPEPPQRQRVAVTSPPRPVAPGLGDLKRLASRRWPEAEAVAPGTVF